MSGLNTEREVFDIVHAINVLAMAITDVIHIFTELRGQENTFRVATYDSCQAPVRVLMAEEVELSGSEALNQLLSLETQVTELVIEARDEAVANAEVTA